MFSQRSSLASSYLTGLIGWIGFLVIGELVFGFGMNSLHLVAMGAACAIIQVTVMRLLFRPLAMNRHVLIGTAWGFLLGAALYAACALVWPALWSRPIAWLIVFTYIGAPVGAFLSYFHRDDREYIAAAGGDPRKANYSRDAHWLEPFAYGVVAYLVAFVPFSHADLAFKVVIVGAMSGVFAAGASHFSPDGWKRVWPVLILLALVLGAIQGAASGWLFRAHASELHFAPWVHGAIGGVLTYAWTLVRGRQLAGRTSTTAH